MEHAYRSTAPAARAELSMSRVEIAGDTSHDHPSALVGPEVAQRAVPSAIYDTTCLRRESRKLQAGSFISAAPPRPPPAARCRGAPPFPPREPGLNNGISLFALFALFGQSALNNANNANNEAA